MPKIKNKGQEVHFAERTNHVLSTIHLNKNENAEKRDFAAIVDAGFTGFAVCGQKWLNMFKKYIKNLEGYGTFDFNGRSI